MKIALDNADGLHAITSYQPGRVHIRDRRFTSSLLVLPDAPLQAWPPTTLETLQAGHFAPVVAQAPELLILGTGETHLFPEPAVLAPLMAHRIGVESMQNAAACRTFNVLLAEQRRVALALLIDTGDV